MKPLIAFVTGIALVSSCKETESLKLVVTNSLDINRTDPVVIKRSQISSISKGMYPVAMSGDGNLLPGQYDDLDGDGEWDEWAVVVELQPKEVREFLVSNTAEVKPVNPTEYSTNIRLGKRAGPEGEVEELLEETQVYDSTYLMDASRYQMEGVGWENDKVGFRVYFDPRNGKDIFGKRRPEVALNTVGLGDNYHELSDWGMDILKVGNSLGAGSVAVAVGDSLYGVRNHGSTSFKIITEGPVRSLFQLVHLGVNAGNHKVKVTEQITIWKGRYGYENVVTIDGFSDGDRLATGIVNLKSDSSFLIENGTMISLSTYDFQTEKDELLGMSVITDKEVFAGMGMQPEGGDGVTQTFSLLFKQSTEPVNYHFMAGWVLSDPQFATIDGYKAAVEAMAQRLATPVSYEIR